MTDNNNRLALEGIKGINTPDNPDFLLWQRDNADLIKNRSPLAISQTYINHVFLQKYGEELYEKIGNDYDRNKYLEHDAINTYLKENYEGDPNYSTIEKLTDEGKRSLFNSKYLNMHQISREVGKAKVESNKAKANLDLDSKYGQTSSYVKIAKGSSTYPRLLEDNLDILNEELERDKKRMMKEAEALKASYFINLQHLSNEEIEQEFDRIFSGYDVTIDDPNLGEAAIVHVQGSNYYNTFKDTKWLNNLDTSDKRNYIAMYHAIANSYGVENAIYYIDSELQNYIADKQEWYDALGDSAASLVKDVPAVFMEAGLMVYGGIRYGIFGNEGDFGKYMQGIDPTDGKRIQDGFNIDFWSKAQEYNTWNSNLIAEAERNGGISEKNTVWTKDQENAWISSKTIADVGEQAVWLMVSILSSYGTGALAKWGTKGLSAAGNALKSIYTTEKAIKAIDTTSDVIAGAGRYAKLFADAAPIALIEGQGAFSEALDANMNQVQSLIEEEAEQKAAEAIKEDVHKSNIEKRALDLFNKFKKDNPNVSSADIDFNVFLQKAEEEYKYILKSTYTKEIEGEFEGHKEAAVNSAVSAFCTTTLLSSIKTAGTNIGFKHFLYGAPFRKNFNINSPNIVTSVAQDGTLSVVKPSIYTKYVAPLIRNTGGEAFDEFMDTEIAAIGVGYGTGKFNAYLNNENRDIDSFNNILAGIEGAIISGISNFADEQSYREGFLGLVSGGALTVPRFRFSKAPDGSSFLERVNHHFMNPILNDILEVNGEYKSMQEKVEKANEIIKAYSPMVNNAGKIMQAANDLQRATIAGYDVGMKSSKHDLGVTLMQALDFIQEDDSIGSHQLASEAIATIERAAKGEISDAEVEAFFMQEENRDLKGKITFEEAKARIQENAKDLLSIRKEIQKTKNDLRFDIRYTELENEVKDAVVRNILKSKEYIKRAEELKSQLGIHSSSNKVIVGSKKDFKLKEIALNRALGRLNEKAQLLTESDNRARGKYRKAIQNKANAEYGTTSKKSRKYLLKEIERSRAKLLKELDLLHSNTFDENGFSTLLDEAQILSLDANSLAYILDPENSSYFSSEQNTIIQQVRNKLSDTISKSKDLTFFPTIDNSSYYAKIIADLENAAYLTDRHTEVFLNYGSDGVAADRHIKENTEGLTKETKEAILFDFFDSHLYNVDGSPIDINKAINLFTFNDPDIVETYIEERKIEGKKGVTRARAWQKFLSIINADSKAKLSDKISAINIVKTLLEGSLDIESEKDLNEAISKIANNYSPEINNLFNRYLKEVGLLEKQRKATVVREEQNKNNEENTIDSNNEEVTSNEESSNDLKPEESQNTPEEVEKNSEEEITREEDIVEYKNDQADSSLEDTVVDSKVEDVKVTTTNDPNILSPIEDSIIPDEEDEVPSVSPEQQGNTHYRYEGSAARNGVLNERTGAEEGDTTNSVFKWLEINKVKLQEIIDNELADIAKTNPDVHFMMLTSDQYGEGFSLNNVIFQVVKYTKDIEKIHNKDRGGVIESNGEKYLIIGTAGATANNEVSNSHYMILLNMLKKERKSHSGPYYISEAFTKIKKIEAGWVINSIDGPFNKEYRTLDELFNNPVSNPHGLSIKRAKWLIQENTKIVTVGIKDNEVVHAPIDVKGNSGAIFLMVPAANGHLIPIAIKPKLLHEIEEVSALRDRISATIAGLTSKTFEARLAAKRELSKLLVISKEGEGVFLSKDENKVVITYMGGKGNITINLGDVDATAQLEKAFFSKEAGFKLNLSEAILGQYLEDYIEAKALVTDAAILGTANASYTTYAVDSEGKPIIEEVVEPSSNNNRVENSDYISSTGTVIYKGKEYTEKEGELYDSKDKKITDPDLIREIKTAKWLAKHPNITPVREDSKVAIYILSDNINDPKVIRVRKNNGGIEILGKKGAIHEIKEQERITKKEEREKAAKHKLQSLDNLEEENEEVVTPKEEDKSVDDLVNDLIYGETKEEEKKKDDTKEDKVEEGRGASSENTDNSILSDGIVNTSTESKMRTADFFGSEHITEEYLEILDSKGLADLQGEKLESKLRELGISEFIDPNNKEEVESVFDNLRNCH